jgi:hypothetical protein
MPAASSSSGSHSARSLSLPTELLHALRHLAAALTCIGEGRPELAYPHLREAGIDARYAERTLALELGLGIVETSAARRFVLSRGHDAICGRRRSDDADAGREVSCSCGYDDALDEL